MFNWQGFGEKHLNFISTPIDKHKKITILKGAIRSGKTTAMIPKWLEFLAQDTEHLKIIAGVSKDTVYDNILADLFDFFEHFNIPYEYNSSSGMLKVYIKEGKYSLCKIVGAEKAGSERKIRGKTLGGAYIDELTLINYRFFKELLGRCSVKGSKIFCTTNPDSPDHWYNKEFGSDNPDVEIIKFTIDDNATLPDDYKEFIKRQYKGVFYSRFILGLDVVAEGLVYDTFSLSKHTCNHSQMLEMIQNYEFIDYIVGVDFGFVDETAVTLFGVTKDKTYYLIDELYKTHIEVDDIADWLKFKQEEYHIFIKWINADASRPEGIYKLQKLTNIPCYGWKPKVEDSVSVIRGVINFDRLIVNKEKCRNFLNEIQMYRYPDDDERLKAGVNPDKPIDGHDHLMDSSRYCIAYSEAYCV